ncbi:MAG: hypothetical protein MO847_01840 [Candidatus Protistobacter heckmanni]|nr:hypothetical protein [Candidatus Protistobacter heckmanni]
MHAFLTAMFTALAGQVRGAASVGQSARKPNPADASSSRASPNAELDAAGSKAARMLARLACAAGCAALLAACGGAPKPQAGPVEDRAELRFASGLRHFQRGQYAAADADMEAAAFAYLSLDMPQRAVDALSLQGEARINAGRLGEARMTASALQGLSPQLAPAAPLRAQLLLCRIGLSAPGDAGLDEADRACAQAEAACAACAEKGAVLTLRAAVALRRGQAARTALAQPGLSERDTANAQRMLGDALAAAGDPAQSEQAYLQALALDKKINLPQRVAEDLLRLEALARKQGRQDAARDYAQRARLSAEAAGVLK